jgi:hypothetical protein
MNYQIQRPNRLSAADSPLRSLDHLNLWPALILSSLFIVMSVLFISRSLAATTIPGDINADGSVNVFDLSILLNKWGGTDVASDVNKDGIVNIFDLSTVLSNWGKLPPAADTTPPSIPTGLSATPVSTSQINLSWTASADSIGVTGYNVFRNGIKIATTPSTTYSSVGLTAATTYSYSISAFDAAGNASALTGTLNATTLSNVALDPGPPGDFFWKGLNWRRRTEAGAPAYNGKWGTANVLAPDANGYVTLRITNPTGSSPISAEFNTTRGGFGYGTYTDVVAARLDTMHKSLVLGGLFTYDNNNEPTHNEVDIHETSAWGGTGPVSLDHTYYKNVNGNNTGVAVSTPIPADVVQTHRLIWEPGKLTWDSFIGTGTGGQLIKHTVQTVGVPVPATEALCINLWAFDTKAANVGPFEVVLRDFSFVPAP